MLNVNGFLVSKETVVLLRWDSEIKIWFYQTSLQKSNTTVKDLESLRLKPYPFVRAHDEGLITGEKRQLSKSVTVVIRRMQANPRSPSLSYLKFH